MRGIAVVSRRREARDGTQQVMWVDAGAHLTRCGSCFKQGLEGGAKSLSEVGGQSVIRRVARMQSCCKSAFSGNEVDVTLHPPSQRLAGFMLARQDRCSVCAGVDLMSENAHD